MEKNLIELSELAEKYQKEETAWFRNVLVMASALFGILVSLHKPPVPQIPAYLFASGLCMLGLGILSGAIVLYLDAHIAIRKFRSKKELIRKNQQSATNVKIETGRASSIFAIARLMVVADGYIRSKVPYRSLYCFF